jgi:hypothetical protein
VGYRAERAEERERERKMREEQGCGKGNETSSMKRTESLARISIPMARLQTGGVGWDEEAATQQRRG